MFFIFAFCVKPARLLQTRPIGHKQSLSASDHDGVQSQTHRKCSNHLVHHVTVSPSIVGSEACTLRRLRQGDDRHRPRKAQAPVHLPILLHRDAEAATSL